MDNNKKYYVFFRVEKDGHVKWFKKRDISYNDASLLLNKYGDKAIEKHMDRFDSVCYAMDEDGNVNSVWTIICYPCNIPHI